MCVVLIVWLIQLPVNSEIVRRLVKDVNDKGVALSNTYGWAGEASIHCSYNLFMAEPPNGQVLHLKQWKKERSWNSVQFQTQKDFMQNMHVVRVLVRVYKKI